MKKGHLLLSFYIQFFMYHVSMALQFALAFAIERKIALVGDACYRPPIIITFHDYHACNIIRAIGEIASYHQRN